MREFTVPPMAAAPLVGGLADIVFDHAEEDPHRVALGRKDAGGNWRDVTAAAFRDEVLALAKGLIAHGVRFGDRVALMSRTRYEWTLFDLALWTIGAQSVPVYPTSSAEQVLWMLHDAEVSAVLVEHEDHAMTIASVIDRLPGLKRLWQLDSRRGGRADRRGGGGRGRGGAPPPPRGDARVRGHGHLHLGNDGAPQGLCTDARPLHVRDGHHGRPLEAGLPLAAG